MSGLFRSLSVLLPKMSSVNEASNAGDARNSSKATKELEETVQNLLEVFPPF